MNRLYTLGIRSYTRYESVPESVSASAMNQTSEIKTCHSSNIKNLII